MKKQYTYTFCFLVITLLLSSCVPKKKYAELEESNKRWQKQVSGLKKRGKEFTYTEADMSILKQDVTKAQSESDMMRTQYETQVRYVQDVERRYNELLEENKLLLNASSSETQQLSESLAAARVERDDKIRELDRLQQGMGTLRAQLDACENAPIKNCDEYQRQVNELNSLLNNKDAALLALKTKVNQALLGFSNSDLTVTEANGKVYVSLSQDLLFASGSDKIDWKGRSAIRKLGEVLKANPDINILVEGHTDSDGSSAKNWDLSVRRATAVVKELTGPGGVAPKNVTAAGRAFYLPVASNATREGKAKNRRTDIILTPNLDDLYKLINQ
ncbi:MAG: chemotaxis protein MotB [Polaribacter sp.]|jgi:chemotaxis protein MotB